MKKISILTSTLLLASFLVIIDMRRVTDKPTYRKEMVYMNILLAILNDPDFLSMSYPEQYKILDGFYNHVKIYLKEDDVVNVLENALPNLLLELNLLSASSILMNLPF